MAVEIFIPKMSDHMETGRLSRWLFHEGDTVKRGDVICEVETDKAVGEMQAEADGILRGIRVEEGTEVPVGQTIAWILNPGEVLPAGISQNPVEPAAAGPVQVVSTVPVATDDPPDAGVRATPLARRLARELKIDLVIVTGTGPNGIIRDEDVSAASRALAASGKLEPFTTLQRITGERMLESIHSAPHFSMQVKVSGGALLEQLEQSRLQVLAETAERLSLTILLVRAVALTLRLHPRLNARVEADGLRLLPEVNIGVAVDGLPGLAVPVLRSADHLSLSQITRQLRSFQQAAAVNRFSPDDLEGGTFTVSNLGMLGVDSFQAIINPPQVAILAVGRVFEEPSRLADGGMAWAKRLLLTLSVDHRAVDGAQAARFLADLKTLLETPGGLLEDAEKGGKT